MITARSRRKIGSSSLTSRSCDLELTEPRRLRASASAAVRACLDARGSLSVVEDRPPSLVIQLRVTHADRLRELEAQANSGLTASPPTSGSCLTKAAGALPVPHRVACNGLGRCLRPVMGRYVRDSWVCCSCRPNTGCRLLGTLCPSGMMRWSTNNAGGALTELSNMQKAHM